MLKTTDIQDTVFPDCPIRNVLSRIGDKWSMIILHNLLLSDKKRFSSLCKEIPDISQKVLTSTLRNLEEDGFVVRKVYPQVPPKVEYSITERGRSYMDVCHPVFEWVIGHMAQIIRDRSQARNKLKQQE